jgi:hypothetical protein
MPALRAAGLCLALHLAPVAPAWAADTKAFAFTSDFSTGSLSVVNLATRTVSQDVEPVNSDAALRYDNGALYVVNRFGGDNIQVIDPVLFGTLRQFSVGNGSNPQDITFVSPTKAYVSRYGSASLLVVNPSNINGLPQSSISLAGFADGDGLPEMAHMIRIDRYLFVACQRLTNFAASNPSVVVVVDTQTDQVVDVDPGTPGVQAIPLSLRNPVTSFEYDKANARLLIGCAGNFGVLDGGVEAIDPYQLTNQGVRITETELGGDINDVVWHTATHAYALVGNGAVNRLVVWNPTTGLKTATPLTVNGGFSLPDMEMNDRNELYVCKNPSPATGTDLPGLLVFNTATDALLAGPLNTGLPPIAVTFDHPTDTPLSVPGSTAASLELRGPWPNPARNTTRLSLRLGQEANVDVSILDAAGRRVRHLLNERRSAGETSLSWDLRDDGGRSVGLGLYFVRVDIGEERSGRSVVVIR